MQILFISALMIVALAVVSGSFILWNIPFIPSNEQIQDKIPDLTVIIPVRNEEKNIPHLLDSLKMQNLQPKQIIVVDDESTDKTVEAVSRYEVEIKVKEPSDENTELVGKTAACYRGAKDAKGNWLIFIDADTYFDHPDSLQEICEGYLRLQATGLLTIQPYHFTKKFYEHLSAPLNIIVAAGLNCFTPFKNTFKTGGAFGPFILCTAEEYKKTGGHKEILDSHLDNFMLAKLYQTASLPVHNYGGKDVISFRMYPEGPKQWLLGWSKSIANGSSNTHPLILAAVSIWITGGFIIPILIGAAFISETYFWAVIGLILYGSYAVQFLRLAWKVGDFPIGFFFVYPLLLAAFVLVFSWSFIQVHVLHAVTWRDRKIDV